jgi:hypothetical protein
MGIIKRKPTKTQAGESLISATEAAKILDLNERTVRGGMADTHTLTQVRRGHGERQRVSFVLEEVIALKDRWIFEARQQQKKFQTI